MWALALGLPLIASAIIAVLSLIGSEGPKRARHAITRFAWVLVLPAGATTILDSGELHTADWMLLGTSVQVDLIALPLTLMAVFVYGLAIAFIVRSKAERPYLLTAFMLMCFVGNIGVFVAADLVTFYLSFAAMSFLGYPIVVHSRTSAARRAGAIYLVLTVLGETAVLSGLLLIAGEGALAVADAPAAVSGSERSGVIILLLLIGFGVKAGTVPLHIWLPLAHPAAPTPASAVLSGVMLKAGVVGWLRMLPLGEGSAEPGWGAAFLLLALVGGLLAVPVGLLQNDPKVILAYSSISQMGFIAALVGAALVEPALAPACVAAAVLYSVHHGIVKSALFLGVQAWDSERMHRWAVLVALAGAGLSLVGVPFTSGYLAKYSAKNAVEGVHAPGLTGIEVADVLTLFAVGSTLLLARFAAVMWRRARAPQPTSRVRDLVWALGAVGAAAPVAVVTRWGTPPLDPPAWLDPSTMWTQTWPLLIGIGAAVVSAQIARRPKFEKSPIAHPRGDVVPPGDLVVLEEKAAIALTRAMHRGFEALGDVIRGAFALVRRMAPDGSRIERAQLVLGTWSVSGAALVLVIAVALAVALGVGR